MHKTNWLIAGIMGFVIILILFGAGMLMSDSPYREWGMMGPIGMREHWGYSYTPAPLGWIGMIFMLLIPVASIVLAAFGIVWLVQKVGNSKLPPS